MSSHPAKRATQAIRASGNKLPVERGRDDLGEARRIDTPFVSFTYSHTEIRADSSGTHIRSERMRLERGRLATERFEGTFERGAFDHFAHEARRLALAHTAWMLRSLFWFLPGGGKRDTNRSD